MSEIAIVSLAYNRTDSLKRQLASLEQAYYTEDVDLCISIDKSDTDTVELLADRYEWKHGHKRVLKHSHRMGTRNHVISLGELFNDYAALIVLEDDTTVAPSFYLFSKTCIEKYNDEDSIAGISLYSFNINYQNDLPFSPVRSQWDVYLMNCAQSWGQVWMRKSWLEFKKWYDTHSGSFNIDSLPSCLNEWPDKSWLKFHTRYCIESNKYFVYPYCSLSTNNADPGVNQKATDSLYQTEMLWGRKDSYQLPSPDECDIKYDGFFNPKFLAVHLGTDDGQLTTDLYGTVPLKYSRRYLLSTRPLPYKVIRQFSLELHPMEANVMLGRKGSGIWLYDTSTTAKAPDDYNGYSLFYHYYKKAIFKSRTMIGMKGIASLVMRTIINKITEK